MPYMRVPYTAASVPSWAKAALDRWAVAAGVCQVLEDRESPTGYEEMKANHGQLLRSRTPSNR